MVFAKYKYTFTPAAGVASFNTDAMRGMIEQILIIPTTASNTYAVSFTDKDGDVVYQLDSIYGRLDDRSGLPIGKDNSEKWTVNFTKVGINESINIIFKVREIY